MKLRNKYYIVRHGEALSNVKDIISCWPEKIKNPLTKKGKEMINESANKLMNKKIDLIFASPLLRTMQTAEIISKKLKVKVKIDKRLREMGFGILNLCSVEKLWAYFKSEESRIREKAPRGETYLEVLDRMLNFIKDIDKKYKGKNILIVSHEGPLCLLQGKVEGFSIKKTIEIYPSNKRIKKGEIRELK